MSEGPPEQGDVEEEEEMEGQEWNGHRLLTMAGLFDVWRPADVSIRGFFFFYKRGEGEWKKSRKKIRKKKRVVSIIH